MATAYFILSAVDCCLTRYDSCNYLVADYLKHFKKVQTVQDLSRLQHYVVLSYHTEAVLSLIMLLMLSMLLFVRVVFATSEYILMKT